MSTASVPRRSDPSSAITQEQIRELLAAPSGTSHALTVLRDSDVDVSLLIAAILYQYYSPQQRLKRALLRLAETFFEP